MLWVKIRKNTDEGHRSYDDGSYYLDHKYSFIILCLKAIKKANTNDIYVFSKILLFLCFLIHLLALFFIFIIFMLHTHRYIGSYSQIYWFILTDILVYCILYISIFSSGRYYHTSQPRTISLFCYICSSFILELKMDKFSTTPFSVPAISVHPSGRVVILRMPPKALTRCTLCFCYDMSK